MAYTSWSVVFGEQRPSPSEAIQRGRKIQPSAAKWNILGTNDASFNDGSGIASGAATISNIYCFRAYASVAVTITSGTPLKITFGTEEYDYGANFASSTYTAPVNGVYHFDAGFTFNTAVGANTDARAFLYKNGALAISGQTSAGALAADASLNVSGDILLTAGQTVDVYGVYTASATELTSTGTTKTWFSGHLVHKL